jgi:hypothetical protein
MNQAEIILFINIAVCAAIAYVAGCRLNVMNRHTVLLVRAKYTALMAGSLTMAALPVLFEMQHTWVTVCAALLVLAMLLLEMPRWRHGPPPCYVRRTQQE